MTTTSLFEKTDQYIAALTAPEDDALRQATARIRQERLPDQSISPVQGKMLQVFAKAVGAKRILELGTFGAYSTIWLARALPADGKLITVEYDETHARVARQNLAGAGLAAVVELRTGSALERLREMIEDNEPPFDLIFIDADKPPYLDYFTMALRLSRKGSMIVCDNVIRAGKVLAENAGDEKVKGVQRLNRFLKDCSAVTATILQTVGAKEHDGMVLAVVN